MSLICTAIVKKTGIECTAKSKENTAFCGRHTPKEPIVIAPEDQCTWVIYRHSPGARQCDKRKIAGDPHNECRTHHNARVVREQKRALRRRKWEVLRMYGHDIWTLITESDNVPDQRSRNLYFWSILDVILQRVPADQMVRLEDVEHAAIEIVGVPRFPVTREARIARDNQNIHTREVSEQTNRNIELLMLTPIVEGQPTIQLMKDVWAKLYRAPGVDVRLYDDIQRWYDTETCRTFGDRLYRKVLDHLVARILLNEKVEIRVELWKRLQQECAEAFNMCCDGHINRLANVMVGFDAEFRSPDVSKNEYLGQKMSVISQIKNKEERMREARVVLTDLNIGQEEAAPWLEALDDDEE